MNISVELTLTPLHDNYEPAIIHFIKQLRASDLKIIENPLSTQVYGNYDEVMRLLTTEIEGAFNLIENGVLLMKIVKTDRSDYEPYF